MVIQDKNMSNIPSKIYKNLKKLGNITTQYGGATRNENPHKGIDVANRNGTPIKSFTSGTVAGVKTGMPRGGNSYGNSILIRSKNGDTHRYSHLKDVLVNVGQKIKEGQKIATMGDTGNSYSPSGGDASHLDYRILDAYGKYRNPAKRLKKQNNV